MRRVLLLPMLLAAAWLAAGRASAQAATGSNGIYDVAVDPTGEYGARTGPSHPNPGLNVFYNFSLNDSIDPATTWNSVRSYDSFREWVLRSTASGAGSGFTCAPMQSAGAPAVVPITDGSGNVTGARSTWTVDDRDDRLTITQEVNAEGTTLGDSSVRVTLCVRNDDTVQPARIGLRFLWDWQIAGFDGPFIGLRPPDPPTEPYLSIEQTFAEPSFESYDVSSSRNPSVDRPFYRVGGTVNGPSFPQGPTHPQEFQYVSWPPARNTCFDYATSGLVAGGVPPVAADSAVTYTWGTASATAITLAPLEERCVTQHVYLVVNDPVPPCSVTAQAWGGVSCGSPSAVIDASPSAATECAGTLQFRFVDPSGAVGRDWHETATFETDVEGTWTVEARCSVDAACADSVTIDVILEQPPRPGTLQASDVLPCNLGIDVTWTDATWADGAGGAYDLHRSEISCADALARAPLVANAVGGAHADSATSAGIAYYYVLVAESATPSSICPAGRRGGAIATTCVGPVAERADPTPPAPPCWSLRASHAADTVKLDWSRARPLLGDEHVHVHKATAPSGPFTIVSPEGFVATTWSETDTASRLQLFDVRFANSCEIESPDDEPPGWDPPVGVPCR